MPTVTIVYQQNETTVQTPSGTLILDVLRAQNIPISAPCGRGKCGKCRVQLTAGGQTDTVLACVTEITQDCTVEVAASEGGHIAGGEENADGFSHGDFSGSGRHGRHGHPHGDAEGEYHGHHGLHGDDNDAYHDHHGPHGDGNDAYHGHHGPHGRHGHPGRGGRPYGDAAEFHHRSRPEGHPGAHGSGTDINAAAGCGAAVDLGTTTVVIELYSLSRRPPHPIGVISDWNAQLSYGSDVITRVQYIMTHADGLDVLSERIRGQIADLTRSLCEQHQIPFSEVKQISVAGNTIMQHIFAGIDPSSIAAAPYTPQTLFTDDTPMHFAEFPDADVFFSPCVSGYVGGDITSGLLSSGLLHHPGCALFLDIGTNGEMALCENGQFLCCSVASGPAFEGAEITCGMRSVPGAVSRVTQDGPAFSIDIISNAEPLGICGSGLIDLLAVLLKAEIIDETGRLLPPDEAPKALAQYLTEDENGNGIFHLTDGISFTAADVRMLQLAKAAVAAGIDILLKEAGKTTSDIDTLYLAGGFGTYLNPENAASIGMIPQELAAKTKGLGNSSLAGMRICLIRPQRRGELMEIQRRCRYLELSGNPDFNDLYIDHLSFDTEE